jgi:hypothetical protein
MTQRKDPSNVGSLEDMLKNLTPIPRESSPFLEPEGSPFSALANWWIRSYEISIARTLLEAIEHEVRAEGPGEIASVVCLPAFDAEWAMSVSGWRKIGFSAVLTQAKNNLWDSPLGAETQCSVPSARMYKYQLPTNHAEEICNIWRRILLQTRYPEQCEFGCDGVTYHFGYWKTGNRSMAGKTWSPGKTTAPGMLASLANNIRDYVRDEANRDVFWNVIIDILKGLQEYSG